MHFPDTETPRGWGRQPRPCHLLQFLLLILALPTPRSKYVFGTQGKKSRKSVKVSADRLSQMLVDVHKARLSCSFLCSSPRDKPCGQPHPRTRGLPSSTGGVCANMGCAGERAAAGPAQRGRLTENTQSCRRNVQSPQTDSGLGSASPTSVRT